MAGRFLQLSEVGEMLRISPAATYALVRAGELPAIRLGGRGQWRVETSTVETFVQRGATEAFGDVTPQDFTQP